jgi:DNA polymerase-3 subunit epsilon
MEFPNRIVYVDLETTGLCEKKNGIIQIACIYEVAGEEVERFSSLVSPASVDEISDQALERNGRNIKEIYQYPCAIEVAAKFVNFLSKYIQPYTKEDKAYFCAYNAEFDFKFLHTFLRRYTQLSLGNFCWGYKLDPFMMAIYMRAVGMLHTPNLQLPTLTAHFNIPHANKHDAVSDIEAARELFKLFYKLISVRSLTDGN